MEGKVIAITGGASGIGLATASQLLSRGAKISICDINQDALDKATALLGAPSGSLLATAVDVRSASQVDSWIANTVSHFGRLDGAANIAGVIGAHHGTRELKDQDDEQWKLIFDINVTGVMHCMRAELRAMEKGMKDGKGNWSIVNAASIQGVRGFAKHAAYSASKHAVVGLTRSVAKEGAAIGVRVNAVAPGVIETPLLVHALETLGNPSAEEYKRSAEWAMKRNASPDEAANVVCFLLSDAASFVSGSIYSVDGAWNC